MPSINGFAMNGGEGEESYKRNSTYQMLLIHNAKPLVQQSIAQHIHPLITNSPSLQTLSIADLGCSAGPNTFFSINNILEAIKSNNKTLQLQVCFSDQVANDFNTLFKSLPPNREYYATAVPGSFHGRLFPRESLHIVHCSSALHWLSQPPKVNNKGRIFYYGAAQEVVDAYARQYADDVSKFLDARAQEVVPGGLVMLILPARPQGVSHDRVAVSISIDVLGECLMDLARKGIIDEVKVDEFNIPMYFTCPQELEEIVKLNGHFSIERMEGLPQVSAFHFRTPQRAAVNFRAAFEGLTSSHFGQQNSHQIFKTLYPRKLLKRIFPILFSSTLSLFVLLKRKQNPCILN